MTTYNLAGTTSEETINLTGTLEDIAKEIFDNYCYYYPQKSDLQHNYTEEYKYFYPYDDEEARPPRPTRSGHRPIRRQE